MDEIVIRKAELKDTGQLVMLNEQLGYIISEDHLKGSLFELIGNPDYEIIVAEQTQSGQLLGFIFAYIYKSISQNCSYEVLGLVVHEKFRSRKIGVMLLAEIERIALSKGINSITVHSNIIREKAHEFYIREGYSITKTQHVFHKYLVS
jgi:GNAT superfamily N-acetyltransferase